VGATGCFEYSLEKIDPLASNADVDVVYAAEHVIEQCHADDALAQQVPINEACLHETVTGSIDAVVEWSFTQLNNYGEYDEILMAPVVGQLTDDDGSGTIDRYDVPDIVVITDDGGENPDNHRGVLRRVPGDGTGGALTIQRADLGELQVYPYRYSNVALGDVDADGVPEMVLMVQLQGGGDGGGDEGDTGIVPMDSGKGPPGDTAEPGKGDPPKKKKEKDPTPKKDGGEPGDNPVGPPPPATVDSGTPADSGAPADGSPTDSGTSADTGTPISDTGAGSGGSGATDTEEEEGVVEDCMVAALSADGEVLWVATDVVVDCGGHAPAIADLEADGTVEVVLGSIILEGATGALRAQGAAGEGRHFAYNEIGLHSVISDLDGDGIQEIIAGNTLYDSQGAAICSSELGDGFAAVADLDMDGVGEAVIVGDGVAAIMEMDCSVTTTWEITGGGNGGPPTIGDFDADGEPEIGIAGALAYAVYEPDGTLNWSAPTTDESSAATGSLVFDFEGDGRSEVVYADETRLWIFDGVTGDVRLEDSEHASRTLHGFPTVADIDFDGSSEIIVPNGGGHQGEDRTGFYVLGPREGRWLASRDTWNQHAYSITNIGDDLSVPAPPEPNWPTYNNFRSGDPQPVSSGMAPDIVPLAEFCTLECGIGHILVRVRLGNSGGAAFRYGVPTSLYTIRNEAPYLIAVGWTVGVVAPGETSSVLEFKVPVGAIVDGQLIISADDSGAFPMVPECSEDNNILAFSDVFCDEEDATAR